MRGARKVGTMMARKIRPAPVESQPKTPWTKRGRTLSKAVPSAPWIMHPQSAARSRRDAKRVNTGGYLLMLVFVPSIAWIGPSDFSFFVKSPVSFSGDISSRLPFTSITSGEFGASSNEFAVSWFGSIH